MNESDPIYVAGHQGLVGSAIVRRLRHAGFENLLLSTRAQVDLRDQRAVDSFVQEKRPAYVFMAAARVGGIHANATYPADFIRDNLVIQSNLIDAAWRNGVRKLLFLGSSCIYPRLAPQPMKEEYLLTGALEPTNEWYAIAKIAGIKMCQAYRRQYGFNAISAMPTNLYGPGDNFSLEGSHVVPALMRKAHEARIAGQGKLSVWGSGNPRRELLHVDDLADALVFLMRNYESEALINVGCGIDLSIRELAETIADTVGFKGTLEFDATRPDGAPRKLLDVSRLRDLGWSPSIDLRAGLQQTYQWYLANEERLRH
jgi:GDP-L-fucose synthase